VGELAEGGEWSQRGGKGLPRSAHLHDHPDPQMRCLGRNNAEEQTPCREGPGRS